MKAVISTTFLPFFLLCFLSAQAWAIQSKGAIIIASMEGEVSVTNNETGVALSADRVKVGGLIFDGHTVSTGPASKAVLLFSSGTITTLKADSVLNIKKFAQEKFDPKAAGKLGERKDEPSPSETVIDLNLGDMVVDVKKLKKESSFNIDSPVGTAGIRGTVPAIQVLKLPDGGFTQNTSMLRGEIAFTPRAGGPATFLGPGQSLSIGIGANGLMLPAQLGRVDASVMKAIEAEVEQAAAASGAAPADSEPSGETPQGASEEDAPSEDELNESDDERQASAKGVGDDENSTDAVALEKAGLIDLDDPNEASKADSYVEVTKKASDIYDGKSSRRRNSDGGKSDKDFVSDLVGNIDDVVDVTIEAEEIGIKDDAMFDSLLESSENAGSVKKVVEKAASIGVPKDADNMESLFKNVDQADSVEKVLAAAEENVADASTNGAELLGPVIRSADQATKLEEVVSQTETGNVDKSKRLGSLLSVVAKVDAKKTATKSKKINQQNQGSQLDPDLRSALESIQNGRTGKYKNKSYQGIKGVDKLLEISGVDIDKIDNIAVGDPLYPLVAFASGIKDELSISSSFTNITDVVELSEAVADLGLDDTALDKMIAYSDQAKELNEVVATAKENGASANLDKVVANPENATDMKKLADKAKALAGEGGEVDVELLDTVFENAATSDDLFEVVEATESIDGVDVTKLLENADKSEELKKLKDEVEKIEISGDADSAKQLLKSVADNAENADLLAEVVESANDSGSGGSVKVLIKNADKAEAFKAAKDNAGADAGKVATLFKVIEKVDQSQTDSGGTGSEVDAFESLDALVEVAETLVGDDGDLDDVVAFNDILDNVEEIDQLAAALEEDKSLVTNLKSGSVTDIKTAVKDSAATRLKSRFPSYSSTIDENEERAGDLQFVLNHPSIKDNTDREIAIFENVDQLDDLLTLNKALGDDVKKVGDIMDGIDTLDLSSLAAISKQLKFDRDKLNAVYEDLNNIQFYKDLVTAYLDNPKRLDKIFQNTASLETIHDLALSEDRFKGNEDEISLLFNNLDKAEDLAKIAEQFEGDKRTSILSQVQKLSFNYKNDPAKRDKIFANPEQVPALYDLLSRDYIKSDLGRVQIVFDYAEKADAFLAVLDDLRGDDGKGSFQILFSDTENTLKNQGLAKLKSDYDSKYHSVFDENVDIAAEISATASKFKDNPDRLDVIFNNIDKIADINKFANEFSGDEPRLSIFFSLIDDLENLKAFKQIAFDNGIAGGVALDIYSSEPGYLQLGQLDGKFLGELYRTGINLSQIPLKLAHELQTLSLTRAELKQVVSDLINGPGNTTPETSPIDEEKSGTPEFATLSFLLDHEFSGQIRDELVISAEMAFASSFFSGVLDVYEALSSMSEDVESHIRNDGQIHDSLEDALQHSQQTETASQSDSSDFTSYLQSKSQGVLGGRKLSFGSGVYDLSLLAFDELLFASSDHLTLTGNIVFDVGQNDVRNELILLSSGGLSFESDTSVDYTGEILGFGSLNSMEILNVDLYSEEEIHVRSLDNLVINNSEMATSGNGADQVHLIAYNQLAVDSLRFSEQIKQITMEAMTINLYNLNFPDGSMVKLNSQYGGIDGKYPNFNSSVYGRVNFVENIRYSSNLIMDRPSFDQYGTNVTIGQLGQ